MGVELRLATRLLCFPRERCRVVARERTLHSNLKSRVRGTATQEQHRRHRRPQTEDQVGSSGRSPGCSFSLVQQALHPGGGGHPDGHAWDRWFGLQTQPLVSPRRGSASQSRPPGLEGGTAGRAALGSPGALVPADSDPAGLGLRVCVCPGPGPRPCCVLGAPGPSREARRAGRPSEAPGPWSPVVPWLREIKSRGIA